MSSQLLMRASLKGKDPKPVREASCLQETRDVVIVDL